MRTALIGYTGFVGSNLSAANPFTDYYNTANIDDLRGQSYDLVVSAASRADSHWVNQHGTQDLAAIERYLSVLSTMHAAQLVFVSTVCVYAGDTSPDEATPLTAEGLTPYGANRLHLERQLAARFATLAVRLPQLYGAALKKGIVYDLLHDYRVEFIRPDDRFQYYDLRRLWSDVTVALDAGLTTLNVATPALTSARVAADCFDRDISAQTVPGAPNPFARMYTRDMRTVHADLFGGPPGYLMDEAAELAALRAFVADARGASAPTR